MKSGLDNVVSVFIFTRDAQGNVQTQDGVCSGVWQIAQESLVGERLHTGFVQISSKKSDMWFDSVPQLGECKNFCV